MSDAWPSPLPPLTPLIYGIASAPENWRARPGSPANATPTIYGQVQKICFLARVMFSMRNYLLNYPPYGFWRPWISRRGWGNCFVWKIAGYEYKVGSCLTFFCNETPLIFTLTVNYCWLNCIVRTRCVKSNPFKNSYKREKYKFISLYVIIWHI